MAGKLWGTITVNRSGSRANSAGVLVTISPSALTDLGLDVRSDVAGALPVQDVGLWQAELEVSHASEELPNGTGQNDVKIERAVIDCSMLCHGQAAAVITTVCDANLVDCA